MTYTNALRHTVTKKWYMEMVCANAQTYGWTDVLWLADVFDEEDKAEVVKPYNTEWVALTWDEYCEAMDGRPESLTDWFDAINEARAAR